MLTQYLQRHLSEAYINRWKTKSWYGSFWAHQINLQIYTEILINVYSLNLLKKKKNNNKKRLFFKDTKNVINLILGTYTYMLGSKTLGSKCIRILMCNVGKQWSKHFV